MAAKISHIFGTSFANSNHSVGIGAGFSGSFQARQSRLKPFFAWVATKVKG